MAIRYDAKRLILADLNIDERQLTYSFGYDNYRWSEKYAKICKNC